MVGAQRPAAWLFAGVVVLATLAHPPSTALAADEVEMVTLPGGTILARVVDLDGDGSREVVRIVGGIVPGRAFEVEAWRHLGGADWRPSNRVTLPSRPPDGQATSSDHQAALLPWSDGASMRMLVLAGRGGTPFGAVADLSVSVLSFDGAELRLEELPGAEGPARRVDAADLDGDGVDELVVTEGGTRVDVSADIRILRWAGDRFVTIALDIGDEARYPTEPVIGDSDGEGGADIVLGLHTGTDLYRVTTDGSELEVEHAALGMADVPPLAWPMAVAERAIYLFGDSPSGPRVARLEWPRGGEPIVTATTADRTFGWLAPLEHAGGVAFVDDPGFVRAGIADLDAIVRGEALEEVARIGSSPAAVAAQGWVHAIEGLATGFLGPFPYSGPLAGGVDGYPAYVRGGQLLTFGPDALAVREVASFIGNAPVGLAGIDDGWLLVSRGVRSMGSSTYLPGAVPILDGTWLVPAELALRPEANAGRLDAELRGATLVGEGDGAWLASADGGFEVVVHGMPGAAVGAVLAGRLVAEVEVGTDGVATLPLDPRPHRSGTAEYSVTIVLLEPTGHAYSTTWEGRVIREAPSLSVTGETVGGSFRAGLIGDSAPGSEVMVDGEPIATDAEGSFSAVVDAGLLPRDVVVRAVDPIGQEVVRRVQVVGLVDYRQWPWIVIVGVATALFGVGMYLRAPRGRGLRTIERGEGTIEEIDLR